LISERYNSNENNRYEVFWQFVIKVGNTKKIKEILFLNGIETGITNLPDLSKTFGKEQINSKILLSNYIFVPLHGYLNEKYFKKIIKLIKANSKNNKEI